MRKIIVLSFITLDGSCRHRAGQRKRRQAASGMVGRSVAPFFDEADEAATDFMARRMKPVDCFWAGKPLISLPGIGLSMQTCGRVLMMPPSM